MHYYYFFNSQNPEKQIIITTVAFFISGLSENSLQLRKSLWGLVNAKFFKKLVTHGIKFTM